MYDEEIDVRDAEDVDSGSDDSGSSSSSIGNDSSRDLRTPSAKQRKLLMSSGSGRRSRSRLRAVDCADPDEAAKEDPDDDYDVHEAQRDFNKDVDLLHLSQDIKDVFKYISMYYPQKTKLEFRLQPFVPDYLPAVGDADAFIKVIAPDPSVQVGLGLEYLDEPSLNQSDPCLLNLQLRASSKSLSKSLVVKRLENAEKNPKVVEQWIRDINELNRGKSSTFFYSKLLWDSEDRHQNRITAPVVFRLRGHQKLFGSRHHCAGVIGK
ncbi:intraflagellar transport protein 46 homolog isoform X2 [Sipha flava]|uniref:Intraflagellar transport protein 46 homolog n=1 Tax=Sipha flava TaxID=143950 RepID=A0A8B8G308_9HEMI|nr:intraflagellar transport protein 46 homolog isoform X2 [Sipha flava]